MYTSSMYTYVYMIWVSYHIPKELNKKGMEYLSILWGYYDGYRIITSSSIYAGAVALATSYKSCWYSSDTMNEEM